VQRAKLGERLNGMTFAKVFTSPLRRAMRTCELAGFGPVAETDRDLVEWDYGEYEGRVTVDILAERPELAVVPRWLPGRRVATTSCYAGRPRGAAST
jgi:broad specificity phosphatase PhoE